MTLVIRCATGSLDDQAGHLKAQQRNAADPRRVHETDRRPKAGRRFPLRELRDGPYRQAGARGNAHFHKNNVASEGLPPLDTYARISLARPEEMKEFCGSGILMS